MQIKATKYIENLNELQELSPVEDLQDIQLLSYDEANDMLDKETLRNCKKNNYQSFVSATCDSLTKDFNILEGSSFHSSNDDQLFDYRMLYQDKCKDNIQLQKDVRTLNDKLFQKKNQNLLSVPKQASVIITNLQSLEISTGLDLPFPKINYSSTSRNHKSHILKKDQEIEKMKTQCSVLVADLNQKNNTINILEQEKRVLQQKLDSGSVINCNSCKYLRFDSKLNQKRIKELEDRFLGTEQENNELKRKFNQQKDQINKLKKENDLFKFCKVDLESIQHALTKFKKASSGKKNTASAKFLQAKDDLGLDFQKMFSDFDNKFSQLNRNIQNSEKNKNEQIKQKFQVNHLVTQLSDDIENINQMFSSIDELFDNVPKQYANMDVLVSKKQIDLRPYLKKQNIDQSNYNTK